MSWATEDWTAGLSGRVLQKVQELQAVNEKLNRERQQRQLQLDNSEAALLKQKQKYEEVRAELAVVQRELGGVREKAQGEVKIKDRLTLELQAKTAQLYSLEGQLDAARTLSQNLALEIKRLEAELEKLQKESALGESMLFSTPSWNMNSPWDQSGKSYSRGEGDSRHHHARQQLQFGDTPKHSVVPSSFPQQTFKTPAPRQRTHQSEARTPSSVFPWEQDDRRPTPKGKQASSPPVSSFSSSDAVVTASVSRDDGLEDALRKEVDGLRTRVSELQMELQLEKESYRQTESRLAEALKGLNTNEQNLTRSKDELARALTRITQGEEKTQVAEQRVKQLQEELKCQRQNAETSRCNAEQRRKETEREHQKELLELQRERQSMEKQHQQESNKFNQEIQQARTQHNTLQTQYDKLTLQKQVVERDLEEVRGKLKNTQTELTDTQKRETQLQAKLTGALKENEGLAVSVEQLKKKEKSLEADVKRLNEELAEALKLIKELQDKLVALPPPAPHSFITAAGDGFSCTHSTHYDHSPPHQHKVQERKAPKPGRLRGPDKALTYPSGREPGEGIDSEHISEFKSAEFPSLSVNIEEGNQHERRSVESEMESSTTEQDTGIEDTDTDSYMSDSISEHAFKDNLYSDAGPSKETQGQGTKPDPSSLVQLKKENATLRDELRDIKLELDQRLEDLEAQRRAETEARTKLKQFSKKHSSQVEQQRVKAKELKDKESKLESQLELEKKETVRLRELVATLELEAEKRLNGVEREENEAKEELIKLKDTLADMNIKEEQLEDERETLHREVEMLQWELSKEKEERKQEQEERNLCKTNAVEQLKIEELQAELDRLKQSFTAKDKDANMPLTYLQLGNQPNSTNESTDAFSFSKTNISLCESANLHNTGLTKEEDLNLITDFEIGITLEKDAQSKLNSTSVEKLLEQPNTTLNLDSDNTTVLVLELERMRAQRDREVERSKKAQKKLEALQNQVTSQTQQLTLAFESQSKHIENLLIDIQEKDGALQRQGEDLRNCLQELEMLKAVKEMKVEKDTLNTKQFVNTACDLENNKALSNDEEMKPTAQLENESYVNEEVQRSHIDIEKNSNDANLEKCNVKDVDTKQDVELQISSIQNENSASYTDSTAKPEVLEKVTDQRCSGQANQTISYVNEKVQHSHIDIEKDSNDVTLDNFNVKNVDTKQDVELQISNIQGGNSSGYTDSTARSEVLEKVTDQQCSGQALDNNAVEAVETSVILRSGKEEDHSTFSPVLLEDSTNDTNASKNEASELQNALNKLTQLKLKNEQLNLQLQEVSNQEILSIKAENEQLKLQLNLLNKGSYLSTESSIRRRDVSIMTNSEDVITETGCSADPEGKPGNDNASGEAEPFTRKVKGGFNEESESRSSSSAQVHFVQDQEPEEQLQQGENRLQELWLLKGKKHMNADDDTSKTEQSGKSVNTSCDSEINEASSTDKAVQQNSQFKNEGFGNYGDHLHVDVKMDKSNTNDSTLDESHLKDVDTTEDVELQISNILDGDLGCYTDNTITTEVLEQVTSARLCSDQALGIHIKDIQPSVILSPDKTVDLPNCSTALIETSAPVSKTEISELYKVLNELNQLKLRNEQLTLQLLEVSNQDILSIKSGNEQLEKAEPSTRKVKADYDEENKSEIYSSSHVHSVQDQLQDLKAQLQLLSEQNQKQAEELQIWRLSAMPPSESMDEESMELKSSTSNPIVVVREEQLLLPCNSTELNILSKNSRRIVQTGCLSSEITDQHGDKRSFSGKKAEKELDEDDVKHKMTDHLKTETRTKEDLRTLITVSSPTKPLDDFRNLAQPSGPTKLHKDIQSPEKLLQDNVYTLKKQESGLAAAFKTKVMDLKPNTLQKEDRDSYMSSLNYNENAAARVNGTNQDNELLLAPVGRSYNALLRQSGVAPKESVDQGEGLEISGVTDRPRAETKDVKCVCTQTEECELDLQVFKSYSSPQRTISVLNSSTQTDTEQMMQGEEMKLQEEELAESPPLSPVSASEPEKLLFSSSFPISTNPAHLAERIRRNRSRMSAAYDDTEYEPYGLPEVVMKGFADIPSGPSCPYVLRRGLLGTDALPLSIREPPIKEDEEDIEP